MYNGFVRGTEVASETFRLPVKFNESSLPQYVNWRKKGVVTKVKKQVCKHTYTCNYYALKCASAFIVCDNTPAIDTKMCNYFHVLFKALYVYTHNLLVYGWHVMGILLSL